ncbi:MFS transporter [Rickettsia endosymbiont of Oedothorax gibbosus]|uniref:MFS transporter n=1 Tax=Rickettsia endosymbiont of Oedothorax gibbosus TaxID=931099 RepID=UPI002023E10B|nr:MFS transporter [Rickettsia endosymbiont of Oedothorax gibbosus]
MTQDNHLKTALLLFISVFLFACITYINALVIPDFLISKGLSGDQLDHIESIEMLGYIIAGLFLTPLINKISDNKTTIISLILLIIGILNLIMIKDYTILKINFIIMASAYYTYITTTIIKIVELTNNYKYFALIIFSLLWIAGQFTVDLLAEFLESATNGLLLCVSLYSFIIITCLQRDNINKNTILVSRFSFLIENIELQVLTGFMVSYITFDILWYYEEFALEKHFPVSKIDTISHYTLMSIFFLISPVILSLKIINKYLANLILMIILLASFILLPHYGVTLIGNIYLLSTIGVCLCAIFICNILILSGKFEAQDLRTALAIYFTMCAIGIYSGALSSYIAHGLYDGQGFLFSTYTVVGTFALYYSWYFFKRKLYRFPT